MDKKEIEIADICQQLLKLAHSGILPANTTESCKQAASLLTTIRQIVLTSVKGNPEAMGHAVSGHGLVPHLASSARYLYSFRARQILMTNGQQTLGVGLPWAIAASLVRPSEKVISVSGDGGFLLALRCWPSPLLQSPPRAFMDRVMFPSRVATIRNSCSVTLRWQRR
jgi:hypothetical protein